MSEQLSTADRIRRFGIASWSALGGLALIAVLLLAVSKVRVVWLPLFLAVGLVYLVNPIVSRLERFHVHRVLGSCISYLVLAGIFSAIGFMVVPLLAEQSAEFADEIPNLIDVVADWLARLGDRLGVSVGVAPTINQIQDWLTDSANQQQAQDLIGRLGGYAAEAFRGFFEFILIFLLAPVLAFYILMDIPTLKDRADHLIPAQHRDEARHVAKQLGLAFGGFIRGQLFVALVVGLLSSIGMALIGLPFWLIVGLTAGLLNIIPFVGPVAGATLAVLVALLTGDPIQALWALAIFVGIQQFDNHVVSPLVLRATVKLHPALILLALLIGGSLGGLIGVLLAVPVAAVTKIIIGHLWRTRVLGESWDQAADAMIRTHAPPPEGIVGRLRVSRSEGEPEDETSPEE